MTITRRTAILNLFKTLAVYPMEKAMGQIAIQDHPKLSELPPDAITTLPNPTAEYDGILEVSMPSVPTVHPAIKASGMRQRYDWAAAKYSSTYWANLETGETIKKSGMFGFGKPQRTDLPLPKYNNIPMKKIGYEELFPGEWATIFRVENAPIMKDHLFTGKFFVTDDGVVLLVSGEEKNTAKNGEFKPIKIKMTDFHRRKQDPAALTPPIP